MMHRISLKYLLPAGIFFITSLFMILSYFVELSYQRERIIESAVQEIKQDAAHLSRMAEKSLRSDPQLIEDDLTLSSTNLLVSEIAVISPEGLILSAKDFSWRGKKVADYIPHLSESEMIDIIRYRNSRIVYNENKSQITGMMSFTYPAQSPSLRSLGKGIIYIKYDITQELRHSAVDALIKDMPFILFIFSLSLILSVFLHIFVTRPIVNLRTAAYTIASGDFSENIDEKNFSEIHSLTTAFNKMNERLSKTMGELDRKSRHLESIIGNVVDGIISIDSNGIIDSFNKSAENIFGYSAKDVIGKNVSLLMPEPNRSMHDSYLQNYFRTKEKKIIGIGREVEGLRSDNTVFPLELSVSEIEFQGNTFFIGMVRDISEKKRIEKMKSEFISTVNHELRTPITSIKGSLGLLAGGVIQDIPEDAMKLIKIAQNNSARLAHLINDLLDIDKIIAGKMPFNFETIDLCSFVENAITEISGYASQFGITLETHFSDRNQFVSADKKRLMQVLSNFLSNAIKFSHRDGTVQALIEPSGKMVRVSIRDFGAGVPKEFKTRIFQKFSQADSSSTRKIGGTGLGLAISKELVEQMGGKIGFDSEEGKGATFYFEMTRNENSVIPRQQI